MEQLKQKHMPSARTLSLTTIYQLIYHLLKLDFFDSFDSLSFCIWEDAEVMDILAMKYVTILCALILVILTVFLWITQRCVLSLVLKRSSHDQAPNVKRCQAQNLSSECARIILLSLTLCWHAHFMSGLTGKGRCHPINEHSYRNRRCCHVAIV